MTCEFKGACEDRCGGECKSEVECSAKGEWVKFNLNQPMRFRATATGLKALLEKYESLGIPQHFRVPAQDADGWSTAQAWSVMEDYGPAMRLGGKPAILPGVQFFVENPARASELAALRDENERLTIEAKKLDFVEAELARAREALRAWQKWEAALIMDDGCWRGSLPIIAQRHLDALTPIQAMREAALAPAPEPEPNETDAPPEPDEFQSSAYKELHAIADLLGVSMIHGGCVLQAVGDMLRKPAPEPEKEAQP